MKHLCKRGINILECGLPETLANGTISLNDPVKSSYSSTAKVTCDIGFDASTNEISCEASGKWQEAICIIKGNTHWKMKT
jgi:hypothetical protein